MPKNAFQKDPRRGDDRNLVIVDQDFGEPDLEDKMWLFWIRNKILILGSVSFVILALLALIIYHAAVSFALNSMQEEYQSLDDTVEAKVQFARDYAGAPLAGTAALQAGDILYKEKKYADAANAYAIAQKSFPLDDPFLATTAGRAMLGEAFSKINAGENDTGVALLKTLAENRAHSTAARGEAMYNLALIALGKKDVAGARSWLDAMDRDLDPVNSWQQKKQELIMYEPALMAPAVTPAPEETPEN